MQAHADPIVFHTVGWFHRYLRKVGYSGCMIMAKPLERTSISSRPKTKPAGLTDLQGTNTLPYYEHSQITTVSFFITMGPVDDV
jgi:hypothetical protein